MKSTYLYHVRGVATPDIEMDPLLILAHSVEHAAEIGSDVLQERHRAAFDCVRVVNMCVPDASIEGELPVGLVYEPNTDGSLIRLENGKVVGRMSDLRSFVKETPVAG